MDRSTAAVRNADRFSRLEHWKRIQGLRPLESPRYGSGDEIPDINRRAGI
jgi:hypothetical protein